ncbi:MAG: TlyA family RNA methyltransferase [Chloroflexi bacterium]|nr:TlyA family RNA methyltransferase [Chloroflexota bacterium]
MADKARSPDSPYRPASASDTTRQRLDQALVARGLAESRARAQALVLAGAVLVDGAVVLKPGLPVSAVAAVTLAATPRFVSRGGDKLDHALTTFGIDPTGLVCADIGASTGGFTDCLRQRGAARVYAIDVGYGQLHWRLRQDPCVIVLERTNIRHLTGLPEPVDLAAIDVSFIGLGLVLPVARRLLRDEGQAVALVKPQFEAGRGQVGRGGVVRDPAIHRRVLGEVVAYARAAGFGIGGLTTSPLRGPAGNVEFLIWLTAPGHGPDAAALIDTCFA